MSSVESSKPRPEPTSEELEVDKLEVFFGGEIKSAELCGREVACLQMLGSHRLSQQDFYRCSEVEGARVFGLGDGHGKKGREAAVQAVRTADEYVREAYVGDREKNEAMLRDACAQAADEVHSINQNSTSRREGGGTTLTLVIEQEDEVHVAHIGDSDLRSFDETGTSTSLTQIHAYEMSSQYQTMDDRRIERGEEDGEVYTDGYGRILGPDPISINLARALGNREIAGVIETPDINVYSREELGTKFFILASDGFWEVIGTDLGGSERLARIGQIVQESSTPTECLERIQEQLRQWGKMEDNTTIVVF